MTERGFDTGYWTDPFVKKLSPYGKLLFSYLWTNDHCNQAGTYEIDLETIAFETKLPEPELPDLLQSLVPKVKWFSDLEIVWVKNFIARQSKSPKFLIAAAKCLKRLNNNEIAKEVVAYNSQHHRVLIPYRYNTDSVSIPSVSVSSSVSSSKSKSDKGEGDEKQASSEIKELFDLWNSLDVVKHRKLTGDMTRAVKAASRDFSAVEISQAMKNYAQIVNDEQCFFKYRWTMKDFLKRGLEKFLDLEVALNNYRKGGKTGGKQPKQERRRPIKYIRGSGEPGPEDTEDMP